MSEMNKINLPEKDLWRLENDNRNEYFIHYP